MADHAVARRRLLAAAVLGRPNPTLSTDYDAVTGEVLDVSPHLLIVAGDDGSERRLVIAPWATAWRGALVKPGALTPGSRVIVCTQPGGRVAERIWADIARVAGVIASVDGANGDRTIEVDCGPHRGRRTIAIPDRSSGRIQVRHPRLEPGYLIDVIGVREEGVISARLPATSQPAYLASDVPPAPPSYGGVPAKISGRATWTDDLDRGAAYPMVECPDARAACVGLPYLAIGAVLSVWNVCTGRAANVPIADCSCVASLFCDRCVECGTSPRGRIVELSPAAFVALGGNLEAGCFNARVGPG